jgi:hypothetical protein
VITEKALRDFYARVRGIISRRDSADGLSVMEKTLSALENFFTNLGKPQFSHTEIQPEDPVISQDVNETISLIVGDVGTGYQEVASLREAAISTHNYSSMHIGEIQRRADEIAGLVTDLRLLSDQNGEEVIVFSDNFVDESKIDITFPIEHPPAQTMPGQGSLTLFRTAARSLVGENLECSVANIGSASREATPDNVGRFYEGHFYSYLGEAEPEGGIFHLEEKLNSASLDGLDQASFSLPEEIRGNSLRKQRARAREHHAFVVPGGAEAKFLEEVKTGLFNDRFTGKDGNKKFKKFIRVNRRSAHRKDKKARKQFLHFARNPDEAEQAGFDINSTEIPLTAENFFVVDKGASEEELQKQRIKMLDGNPGSYWQCELVRSTNVIQDYVNSLVAETENVEVSASELRDLASSNAVDREDFEIEIVISYQQPVSMNWITMVPMTFDDGAYLEVSDVSTSPDLESEFVQIESFASNQFANILTEEANEELPKDIATYLLAPSRFSYRGTGVWPFAQRTVQKVRFRLKQRTPTPNPYEKFVLEAERTLTTQGRRRR